jgi:hypothetical protein
MSSILKNFFQVFNYDDKDIAMDQAQSYAKKYPKKFKLVWVDDDYASSSILLFIKHDNKEVETIFIPQCSSDPIVTFYLDDRRIKTLAKVVKELSGDE